MSPTLALFTVVSFLGGGEPEITVMPYGYYSPKECDQRIADYKSELVDVSGKPVVAQYPVCTLLSVDIYRGMLELGISDLERGL